MFRFFAESGAKIAFFYKSLNFPSFKTKKSSSGRPLSILSSLCYSKVNLFDTIVFPSFYNMLHKFSYKRRRHIGISLFEDVGQNLR